MAVVGKAALAVLFIRIVGCVKATWWLGAGVVHDLGGLIGYKAWIIAFVG